MWNSSFATGETYFITVEACNGASLCHSMSSDGVLLDDSPPIPGLVKVGSNSEHQTYISSRYVYCILSATSHINCIVARCLINIVYLTAWCLYQVMMTLHLLNDVANDAESTQKSKITS